MGLTGGEERLQPSFERSLFGIFPVSEGTYLVHRTWNLNGLSILYSFPAVGRGGGTEAPNEPPLVGGEGAEAMAMQEAEGFSFPFMMSSQGKASSCEPWEK